jgi:hypothetical protein
MGQMQWLLHHGGRFFLISISALPASKVNSGRKPMSMFDRQHALFNPFRAGRWLGKRVVFFSLVAVSTGHVCGV